MAKEMTLTVSASTYRVNFMTNHPITGELLFSGDVVAIPDHAISARQMHDGLFTQMPDETPENRVPREEPNEIIGVNISEREYEARLRLASEGSQLPPELLATERDRVLRQANTTRE